MTKVSRRGFFKVGLASSGALLLTYCGGPGNKTEPMSESERFHPRAWFRMGQDGRAVMTIPRLEMGQGIETTMALAMAEELGLNREQVTTEMSHINDAYAVKGNSSTGASDSMYQVLSVVQRAAATAREMLISTAAQKWGADPSTLSVANGSVVDGSGKSLAFGALYQDAVKIPVPSEVKTKTRQEWNMLGRPQKRLDGPDKVTGKTTYSQDLTMPGMKVAIVIEPEMNGGWIKEWDASDALKLNGVHAAYEIGGYYKRTAVALVADNFWIAEKARKLVKLKKVDPPYGHINTDAELTAALQKAMDDGTNFVDHLKTGNAAAARESASKQLEAVYNVGYQAHQCMEPSAVLAVVKDGKADIHVGTQNPYTVREWVSSVLGFKPEQVTIHNQYTGGAFGARSWPTAPSQAAEIAKLHGTPIKLMYNRADEFLNTYMHGFARVRMRGGLDDEGNIAAWEHLTSTVAADSAALNEGLRELDYKVGSCLVESVHVRGPVRCINYRSVGRLNNVFARECFLDELAVMAKQDPLAYRIAQTSDARLKQTYERLQEIVMDETGLKWGFAGNASRQYIPDDKEDGSRCAVAVGMNDEGSITKVHAVVDCGQVLDPDLAATQVEGTIIWGISSALFQEINLENGAVKQRNFDTARLMRMGDAPEMVIHFIDSTERPTGVSELALPMTIAAVGNAIFAFKGERQRDLPFKV